MGNYPYDPLTETDYNQFLLEGNHLLSFARGLQSIAEMAQFFLHEDEESDCVMDVCLSV